MMDTNAGQTDAAMRDGLGLDAVLGFGAILALAGWGTTQFLASTPGFALATVGVESTVLVVAVWIVVSTLVAAVVLVAGAPAVLYSPLLWLWGVLVAGALAVDAAVVLGVVPPGLGRTLLWTPWPVVIGLGYAVTGVVATHRNRGAYLVGSLAAGLVVLAAVLFPSTVTDWAFAATGVVHAVPLVVDARTADPGADAETAGRPPRSATPETYEFRDLRDAIRDDDAAGGNR